MRNNCHMFVSDAELGFVPMHHHSLTNALGTLDNRMCQYPRTNVKLHLLAIVKKNLLILYKFNFNSLVVFRHVSFWKIFPKTHINTMY